MIYLYEQNIFVDSLKQIQADNYDFYKEGCLLNPQKLQLHLKNGSDKPIIGKLKIVHEKKASDIEINTLAQSLDPEEKDMFPGDRRIIFEEWRKFKYIRPGEKNDEFSTERISQIKGKFTHQGRNLNFSSQELDYMIKNWRLMLKEAAFPRSTDENK